MKKILLLLLVVNFIFVSCDENENNPIISEDPTPAVISSPANGFSKVIEESTLEEEITFTWEEADYGVNTQVTYEVQIDSAGRSFDDAAVLGISQQNSLTISLDELNSKLLNDLSLPANEASSVDLRVVSTIDGALEEISQVVTITLTPFQASVPEAPPTLWVPGEYQTWNPATAPVIYAVSETEYEGYVYIQVGSGFKFTSAPDWDHLNYGDSGTPGVLTTDGAAPPLSAGEPGYYRFKVNTEALTYEMYRVETFGLIGTATAGGWDNSTVMTYNEDEDLWTATADLASGALKFRANNDWAVNYGPEDGNVLNGKLIQTDAAISITEPGNYTVTMDMSRSEAPYEYTYTVVKNGDGPAAAMLWVPGEYQEWTPETAPVIYSTSETTFEGYLYFDAATEFKFTSAADWNHVNYGNSGTEGVLTTDAAAGNLAVTEVGYYRLKVDVENLTYEFYRVESFGMIGTATPGAWDNSTPMTFDESTGLWTATADLVNGALKFRANNSWDLNYGPQDSNALEGRLIHSDAAISIPENGNYTVTIDLSRDNAEHHYLYTVTKN